MLISLLSKGLSEPSLAPQYKKSSGSDRVEGDAFAYLERDPKDSVTYRSSEGEIPLVPIPPNSLSFILLFSLPDQLVQLFARKIRS